MRVEYRLISRDLGGRCGGLGRSWMERVAGHGQRAELHQAGHEQKPSLGDREVRAGDERRHRDREPLGVATAAEDDRQAAVDGP